MQRLFGLAILLLLFGLTRAEWTFAMAIDDFERDTSILRLVVQEGDTYPISVQGFTAASEVLGGERDLILVAENGRPGNIMSTQVDDGKWISSSSSQASGYSTLQYDGQEGSNSINHDGLDCADLTVGGTASGFLINAQATFATDFKFTVFGYGNQANATVKKSVDTNLPTYYYIPFDTFNGEVINWECVGAISVTATVQAYSQFIVDTLFVGTYTPDPPSVTPSVSLRPSASRSTSATPSRTILGSPEGPSASASPTPTNTVAPHGECTTMDECPTVNSCTAVSCVDHTCQYSALSSANGCCYEPSDCRRIDCKQATCVQNTCTYISIACIDSNSVSPAEVGKDSTF